MDKVEKFEQPGFTEEVDSVENLPSITYKTKEIYSFSKGIEEIVLSADNNTVCFVDVDGVLIENSLTQYPGICHLLEHNVSEDVKKSLKVLISTLGQDAVSITTNRDERVKLVWSSNRIIQTVQNVLEELGAPLVKIYTALNKQIPNSAKERRERLVDHYVNYIEEKDIKGRLKINVMQDWGFVGLNRRLFPEEIAQRIRLRAKEKLDRDIGIDIIDYVLKK
jgi:hypothetical protein